LAETPDLGAAGNDAQAERHADLRVRWDDVSAMAPAEAFPAHRNYE
jgi:hypothetical protein